MEAKEMFEELGFKYKKYKYEEIMCYKTYGPGGNAGMTYLSLTFQTEHKHIIVQDIDLNYAIIDMKLNKAIQQQIKELGW